MSLDEETADVEAQSEPLLRLRASGTKVLHRGERVRAAEDVKCAIEAGFDARVAKPCDPEQIERLLG